jgi:hypothetical protein
MALKLHGSPLCLDVPFGMHPRVCVRVETSRATYGWTRKLPPPPEGANETARAAFADYFVAAADTDPDDRDDQARQARQARRAQTLRTWYAAVECMTSTPIADLLVHGDVVVRMCEVFRTTLFSNGDLRLCWTHARDVRMESKAESLHAADVTSAIALALGYPTPRAFLDHHRIVGVDATAELRVTRKKDCVLKSGYCRKLTIGPVGTCAAPECTSSVCTTAMALCAPCATRLHGVFHAQTRTFVATSFTRKTRLLVQVSGAELERAIAKVPRAPTLPIFVEPPGTYHLPDDVAAHILYTARLCKERLASARAGVRAATPLPSALAQGIVETPTGALDAARFRPGLEAVYAKLRTSK